MKLSPALETAFNAQITLEFQASLVYRQLAIELELMDLPGMSAWLRHQADEEIVHANKFIDHVADRDNHPAIGACHAPQAGVESVLRRVRGGARPRAEGLGVDPQPLPPRRVRGRPRLAPAPQLVPRGAGRGGGHRQGDHRSRPDDRRRRSRAAAPRRGARPAPGGHHRGPLTHPSRSDEASEVVGDLSAHHQVDRAHRALGRVLGDREVVGSVVPLALRVGPRGARCRARLPGHRELVEVAQHPRRAAARAGGSARTGRTWISQASWVSTASACGHGSSQASQVQAEPSSPPYGSSSTPASSTASTNWCGSCPTAARRCGPTPPRPARRRSAAAASSSTGTVTSTV